jgi:hypothetical protein
MHRLVITGIYKNILCFEKIYFAYICNLCIFLDIYPHISKKQIVRLHISKEQILLIFYIVIVLAIIQVSSLVKHWFQDT